MADHKRKYAIGQPCKQCGKPSGESRLIKGLCNPCYQRQRKGTTKPLADCPICGKRLGGKNQTGICIKCRKAKQAKTAKYCDKCGKILGNRNVTATCWDCRQPYANKLAPVEHPPTLSYAAWGMIDNIFGH